MRGQTYRLAGKLALLHRGHLNRRDARDDGGAARGGVQAQGGRRALLLRERGAPHGGAGRELHLCCYFSVEWDV